MLQLRDYQLDLVNAIWADLHRQNTILISAPTGSGKTECFIELCRKSIEAMPTIKILIILNRVLLVEQTARRIRKIIPSCGIYCGSLNESEINQITVASVQSIYKQKLGKINMVILDEVHHLSEDDDSHYRKLLSNIAHEKLKVVGFTATPFRSNGKLYGQDKLFKNLSYKKSLTSLIDDGFLVRPSMKRVDHQFDTSQLRVRMGEFKQDDVNKLTSNLTKLEQQVKDALPRMADRKSVVWACASIKHCENVRDEIINQGERALALHSKLNRLEAESNKTLFESGGVKHLVFVSIVAEGYDHPPIDCIVLMRPIRSPVLYVQTVGRGLRPFENKKDCLVLDYGKVVETLGPIDNPLVSNGRIKKSDKPLGMKFCPSCLEYVLSSEPICPDCDYEFIKKAPDKTKNLERVSFVGDILSKPQPHVVVEKTIDIIDVRISMFVSRANNKCLKIDYISEGIIRHTICQFFVWGVEWAQKKAQKTLIQLDCDLKSTLEEQAKCKPRKIPKSIVYVVEGGYEKVKRLNF